MEPESEKARPFQAARLVRLFVSTSAIILAISGIAKVYSAFGSSRVLGFADPIFGVRFGNLFLAVGLAEIVVAALCLVDKHLRAAPPVVASLATGFLIYRIGLWGMDWKRPCSCLGILTDQLHISPQLADNFMKVLLAYLFFGSYSLLFWQWKKSNQ